MFGASLHLADMYAPASGSAVADESRKLLAILGEFDGSLASELAAVTLSQGMLAEMVKYNAGLTRDAYGDAIAQAAAKFWAAQALATTVMSPKALDDSAEYSDGMKRAMRAGAEGLFEVGKSQFTVLRQVASELVSWIAKEGLHPFSIIESPLGNCLPVQVVCDLAEKEGIVGSAIEWNAPRNDRPARGQTINEAAYICAAATKDSKLVVLLDDAITGTRFGKLFRALVKAIGKDRFLPVVMRFKDPSRDEFAQSVNWERLEKRVREQSGLLKYPNPIVEFPKVETLRIYESQLPLVETPTVWGGSDLIAGRRKLNLIFTLIEHCLSILEDLGAENSKFRPYLNRAWNRDRAGQAFVFPSDVVRSVFQGITNDLKIVQLHEALWAKAKTDFHDDYRGQPFAPTEENATKRWEWLQKAFLDEARTRLDEQRAVLAWKAIDDAFAMTVFEHRPRPGRDHDAAAYTFRFNPTIAALNERLREKILAPI